jgi:hypothetical protein
MRTYALAWLGWWGGLTALGVTFSAHAWSVGQALAVLVLSGAMTAMVGVLDLARPGRQGTPIGYTVRIACVRAAVGGFVGLAVCMVAAVVGLLVWPLLALATLTSPWALGGLQRMLRGNRGSAAAPAPVGCVEVPPVDVSAAAWAPAVRTMTTQDLCRSWRASFHALRNAGSAGAYAELVSLREAYIDELERRDPQGTRAWLGSGARAAGSPSRFLTRGAQ